MATQDELRSERDDVQALIDAKRRELEELQQPLNEPNDPSDNVARLRDRETAAGVLATLEDRLARIEEQLAG